MREHFYAVGHKNILLRIDIDTKGFFALAIEAITLTYEALCIATH